MFPKKLEKGSHIRVIAPSRSFKIISDSVREIALKRFAELGIKVSYSKNADECDEFLTSSIKSRVDDLHEAFADKSVDAILTAIGGFSSNEILAHLDYDLIKNNPKIICGYSDITAPLNAIYAKTGLVTYYGPHFSSFGMEKGFEYILEHFIKCFMQDKPFTINSSKEWSNDAWYLDQENREFIKNDGHWVINQTNQDIIEGTIFGGNSSVFCALQGTDFFPKLADDTILFIEHCAEDNIYFFNRYIQTLIHNPDFSKVKAIVLGRFEKENKMTIDLLTKVIKSKPELENIPVLANCDFGHTTPMFTFPIGGRARVDMKDKTIELLNF